MPHAIWKGDIRFGLVHIPVGLYSAEKREEKINFTLLDKDDLSPIGYKKYNKSTGKEVDQANVVKGYEYEEGRFVVLTNEELKAANPQATQTVEIIDFVDAQKIHPVFFDKPYYLAPVKRAEKGYALLREALKRSNKAGIARVVIHTKEYIGVLLPYGKVLELDIIRYPEELRSIDELNLPDEDLKKLGISDKELDMAKTLIDSMYGEWQPDKYQDTFHKSVKEYVEKKIAAGETAKPAEVAPEAPAKRAEVIDLMSLLKKSVEEAEKAHVRVKKKAAGR